MASNTSIFSSSYTLNLAIETAFDLDEALTLPQRPEIPRPPGGGLDVGGMPTVEAGAAEACPVCMEGFPSGRVGKRVPCGHVFHQSCITEWSLRHNSCPLCRSKIFQDS